MKVLGYVLPLVRIEGVLSRLYPHQAAVFNAWNETESFLVVTKTGSGKTRAVALPVIKNRESALFVYPTNALIADQAKAIQQVLRDEQVSFREWTAESADVKYADEEYAVVQVNADILENLRKSWKLPRKADALLRVLSSDKRKIVLINPDILYLLLSLKYGRSSADATGHLQSFATVVFDEFHLYHGVELSHALFMIHMARRMGLFAKTVLLSATPSEQVRPILDALIAPNEITANATVYQETIDSRQVVHDVELKTLPCENADQLEVACKKILELKSELQRLQSENREANTKGEYIPCVVILNSVVKAIALEDQLVANGFPRDQLVPIRGLSSRKSRNLNSKQLVIGTSAIEVGIDFQTDYLLFEAGDASSFMQRFGRIGRHCPGIAFLLCDHQEAMSFASLNDSVSRHDFEMAVSAFYPEKDARAWFVFTSMGLLTICSQASNFEKQILSDRSADQSVRERISVWINDTVSDFATKLNVSNLLKPTIHKRTRKWFRDYCEINSFRTSLPSQTVWDVSEKNRGRECTYEVDVRTLLTRAIRIWWNNEHRRLYVSGYGKWKNVWFSKTFEDMPEVVGTLQTTSDTSVFPAEEMVFIQEGHITPVSHVMHTPANHIFIVVPLDVTNHLDWRIAWFRCGSNGSNAIAFDGDALLVKEINDRVTSRRISLT